MCYYKSTSNKPENPIGGRKNGKDQRMAKISERNDWFELWFEDKQSMIDTMVRNMRADLDAGYNYFGNCIQNQMRQIDDYKSEFDAQMDEFKFMDEKSVGRWCYYDLRKRGAIA